MPPAKKKTDSSSPLAALKRNWAIIAQAAAWLYGMVATFTASLPYDFDYATVTARPEQALQDQNAAFGKFLVTVLLGLFVLPAVRWKCRKHQWYWASVGILFVVALVGAYFWQQDTRSSCVAVYAGRNLLVGTTYTPEASDYMAVNQVTPRELIDHFNVSRMDRIWTIASMNRCRRDLLISHLLVLLIGVLAVLTTMQAVRCANSPR